MSVTQQDNATPTAGAGHPADANEYRARLDAMMQQMERFVMTHRPWRIYDLSNSSNNPRLMSLCRLQRLYPREQIIVPPIRWKSLHLDMLRCVFYQGNPFPLPPNPALVNTAKTTCPCRLRALVDLAAPVRDKISSVTALFTGSTNTHTPGMGFTSHWNFAYDHVQTTLGLSFASTMRLVTIPAGESSVATDHGLPHRGILSNLVEGTHTHFYNLAYVDLSCVVDSRRAVALPVVLNEGVVGGKRKWEGEDDSDNKAEGAMTKEQKRLVTSNEHRRRVPKDIDRTWTDPTRDPYIAAIIIGLAQRAHRESDNTRRSPEANGNIYESFRDIWIRVLASMILAKRQGTTMSNLEIARTLLQARFTLLLWQTATMRELMALPGETGGFRPKRRDPTTGAQEEFSPGQCADYVLGGGHVNESMVRNVDELKTTERHRRRGPLRRYRCVCLASSPTDANSLLVYFAAVSTAFLDRLEQPHEPPRVDVRTGLEIRVDLVPLMPLETLPRRLESVLWLLAWPPVEVID